MVTLFTADRLRQSMPSGEIWLFSYGEGPSVRCVAVENDKVKSVAAAPCEKQAESQSAAGIAAQPPAGPLFEGERIEVKVNDDAAKLWQRLKKRYVLYGHRSKPPVTAEALTSRSLFVAWIGIKPGEGDQVLGDGATLSKMLGIKGQLEVQNAIDAYREQMLGNDNQLCFALKNVAAEIGMQSERALVEVDLVK